MIWEWQRSRDEEPRWTPGLSDIDEDDDIDDWTNDVNGHDEEAGWRLMCERDTDSEIDGRPSR